ncbi:MAG TPA: type Z 30S ribosomal protein S14 [Syntrophorhabdaceae bacterium]|nr:type Z 30S ribosomal protein S14 [Syntrophorhabdaceae bacterium]
MARKAMIEKTKRTPKYGVRAKNRCHICGRPRGYIRKFQMCRVCFRLYSLRGSVPGVIKSSW